VFNAFLSSRAVSATPGERVDASAERLLDPRGLRPNVQGLGFSISFSRLHLSSLRATARDFAAHHLPVVDILVPLLLEASRPHAGNLATLSLSIS
jgi:hypothetical protein